MKAKFIVMASSILMVAAINVSAAPPTVPAPYKSGPLPASFLAPNLTTIEKAAFALLEAAMQEAEAVIYQGGCPAAAGPTGRRIWDIRAIVKKNGVGDVYVSTKGTPQLKLSVKAPTTLKPPAGTSFRVTGTGGGSLNGSRLPAYNSTAYYNVTGQMMVQAATFNVRNVNNLLDNLTGTVIKDFYKKNADPKLAKTICKCSDPPSIPIIYDWGLQIVSKNKAPQDKWWQRSQVYRSDPSRDIIGRTHFRKDRLFSAKNGGVCSIDITVGGKNEFDKFATNNTVLFDQAGTLTIKKAAPGPF